VRIVATAEVPAVARRAFAPLGEIAVRSAETAPELRPEILIVRGTPLDADTVGRLRHLRVIARTGAGFDNVDVEAATRLGIPIVYAPRVGSRPIAEGAVALVLAAAKRLRQLGLVVQDREWDARYRVPVLDIEGACLGIVGFGAIGRHVARLSLGLGMQVIAHDPAIDQLRDSGVEIVPLEELLERADVITLHCELTEQTRGLVDRRLLARLKPGAILVNVARGQIVESEDALADALVSGRLSAVALDVFPCEPPNPGHRLYSDPRVICTPHAVGLTFDWNDEVFHCLARDVQRVLLGELPPNVLNPRALTRARPPVDRPRLSAR
jgi:D-3-phosphoglycerate dehydrogenase / 2-oxoglutarate reductase